MYPNLEETGIDLYTDTSILKKFFKYDELSYYRFGLILGVANILQNGLRLGSKKTLGKILQPVNSYSRFPEYHFLYCHTALHLKNLSSGKKARILDVGSPKCFGLYLAFHFNVEVHLTDIDEPSVEEAQILWEAIKHRAKGEVVFSVQDVRGLKYSQDSFDVVYSMSVIEHVQGETGDSDSIREMIRVLKPGAPLLVTVPVGERYVEQDRIGFEGAARETGNGRRYFFQRIYTPVAAKRRIVDAASDATLQHVVTISRKVGLLFGLYRRLGTNIRGMLGCLNPVLSAVLNDRHEGVYPVQGSYGDLHSRRDIYGDLMLAWRKDLDSDRGCSKGLGSSIL
jgi:SAM-dependent methyltransferase